MERHEHIVSSYEEELSFLNNKVAKMGGLAERVVGQSLEALERRDRALAENTIQQDEVIDVLEHQIEDQAIVMIVKRQPVAYDLRQVIAPLRVSTDLERIGDLGKNIAKRCRRQRVAAEAIDARLEAYGRACSGSAEGCTRCLYGARPRPCTQGLVQGRRHRCYVQLSVPRGSHAHDG